MAEKLGRRIADLRAKRGWTQQQLADRLAVSRVAVSHLESGMNVPGERTIALLAGIFQVEPHELVAGTSYPTAKAERLPVVVARYTEVEFRIELLARDLSWLERVGFDQAGPVLAEWESGLRALLAETHDPEERVLVADARSRVAELIRQLRGS